MERLTFDEGSSTVVIDGRPLALSGRIRDAWSHDGAIIVMAARDAAMAVFVYDSETLRARHCIAAPLGWQLDRLTAHVGGGVSAIAWTRDAIHGHHDWHFLVDVAAGTLTRTHPSR
jgi:hypothetical protein